MANGSRRRQPTPAAAAGAAALPLALAIALLAAAALPAPAAAASKGDPPPAMNPYAGAPYAGCDGGFCAAQDPALEAALYRAAAAGETAAARALFDNPSVNLTRNIVPDDDGFVRVVDAAVWAAAKHGRIGAMEMMLDAGYDGDKEEGHVVDLAGERPVDGVGGG
jgi:hypothetical protein